MKTTVSVIKAGIGSVGGQLEDDPAMLVRTQMNFPATGEGLPPYERVDRCARQ